MDAITGSPPIPFGKIKIFADSVRSAKSVKLFASWMIEIGFLTSPQCRQARWPTQEIFHLDEAIDNAPFNDLFYISNRPYNPNLSSKFIICPDSSRVYANDLSM